MRSIDRVLACCALVLLCGAEGACSDGDGGSKDDPASATPRTGEVHVFTP